jgi:3-methyl-2-oxobutanoate hydroxymethyltransferase
MNNKAVTTAVLADMKRRGRKIVMLTAYDYPTARYLDEAEVDVILVGDSLGNVVLGYENTLPVTVDEMLHHTKAVRRGTNRSMLIVDMPFMSYQLNAEQALSNASRFVKEAGANGVKIEGDIHLDSIKKIIDAGIPVMGHLGFTPQLINRVGGYSVTGKKKSEANLIFSAAKKLERIGVFALVLEMVPAALAKRISSALKIPVIGIGAGPFCDGQVLVTHDLVGLNPGPVPRFVKRYANLGKSLKEALSTFIWEVHSGKYPEREKSK